MLKLCISRKAHEQDGCWSWFVCFSATMCWTAVVGLVFSFGVFLPVFMEVFDEDRERSGGWVTLCAQPQSIARRQRHAAVFGFRFVCSLLVLADTRSLREMTRDVFGTNTNRNNLTLALCLLHLLESIASELIK